MTSNPIPLAYFSNSQARGGVEEHMSALLRGLDRKQFRPMLICSHEAAREFAADVPSDVRIVPIAYRGLGDSKGGIQLAHLLRQNRIKILHSHLFYSSLFASPLGWLTRVPVIVETPHLRELWRHGIVKGSFLVDRIIGRFVDAYIAVSRANALYLSQVKKLPASKVHLIHNGTNVKRFQDLPSMSQKKRLTLGFAESDPVALVPARLEPQKGHGVLLQALPSVLKEFPALKVVLVGEGALRDELQAEVQQKELSGSVRFVGRQSDMESWFELCDFSILPSFYEGLPLVAVESLAAGKAMVATEVDGTPEVILNGKTGLTVPPGKPEALAQAICKMLCNPNMRNSMGAFGREWVATHFTEERQIQKTQQLYLELMEQAAPTESAAVQNRAALKHGSGSI
ncbi:MAG: glycosyltransferase family 4 protein [Candidatus Acidiferrales bacterium]